MPKRPARRPARPVRRATRRPARPALEPYVARSEADLVAMVPLALGFHPTDSVVLLTFGPGAFHARVDLPGVEDQLAGVGEELARMLVRACRRNAARRAAVIVYSDDHLCARRQGELLLQGLREAGIDVVDVLRVADGRWYEPLQDDRTGTPYELDCHPFTARGVFEGQAVHADRDTLAAMLRGGEPAERERLSRAAAFRASLLGPTSSREVLRDEAAWVRACVATAVQRVRAGDDPGIGTGDAARLLAAVVRGDLRDAAWVDLVREVAGDHVVVWLDLVRRAPDELVPSVAGLLALAAYLAGDGALAWCAVDRAVGIDPHHSLVRLVADALGAAVPPSSFPPPDVESLPLLRGHG